MSKPRYIRAGASWSMGIWTVRAFGYFFRVKAPWNKPLFSERHAPKGFWIGRREGWRFNIVKVGDHV